MKKKQNVTTDAEKTWNVFGSWPSSFSPKDKIAEKVEVKSSKVCINLLFDSVRVAIL